MSDLYVSEHVSDYDRLHIADIVAGKGDWFGAYLFRLIAKADHNNIARLRLGFPEHVQAFVNWQEGRDA